MNVFEPSPSRQRLADSLARLRRVKGWSQSELARRLKWSQSKISRIEAYKQSVEPADVEAWARATDATDEQREILLAVATDKLEVISIEQALGEGLAVTQESTGELEATTRTLRHYQPVIIPGLLQTPGYIRQVFGAGYPDGRPDIDQAISARIARQEILYDEDRRLEFVITEAALRWRFGSGAAWAEVLGRQINLIKQVMVRPNTSIGVIGQDADAPVWHTHGFVIFDDRDDGVPFVSLETYTAVIKVTDPGSVGEYRQAFRRLQSVAVFDGEARALLDRVARELRGRL